MRTVWELRCWERDFIAAKTGGMVLLREGFEMPRYPPSPAAAQVLQWSVNFAIVAPVFGINGGGDDVGDQHDSSAIRHYLEKISTLLS